MPDASGYIPQTSNLTPRMLRGMEQDFSTALQLLGERIREARQRHHESGL